MQSSVTKKKARKHYFHIRENMKDYRYSALQWEDSADDKLMKFFVIFPEDRIWQLMQTVS